MVFPAVSTSDHSTASKDDEKHTDVSNLHNRPRSPVATSSVQVVVRVRPLNEREKKHGTLPVVSASTADRTVTIIKGNGKKQVKSAFRFDNIFASFSTQEDVFGETLRPIIRDVLMGYESTVFAYGQVSFCFLTN